MKKFSSLLVVLLLMLASFTAGVEYQRGDVDQDGQVGISDVTCLIDYILNGVWQDEPVNPDEPQTETFTVNGVSFTMVEVKGGTFTMGATAEQGSDASESEKPAHEVTLSSYCIGQTEVTQALWQAVMGSNPSYNTSNIGIPEDLQRPVEQVSWYDCQTFITELNQLTGKNFRLPTEAEWEFAARGGNLSQGYKYSGSNTIGDVAWYSSNVSNTITYPVATKAPNELGLYDMSGNVFEWCQDWYESYSSDAQTNPVGPSTGSNRVWRGGSYYNSAGFCRVSYRISRQPSVMSCNLGLRLALNSENNSQAPEEHEYVNLGLPSGTLWATMNVGASCSEDCGYYFAWGETAPKNYYGEKNNYKWYSSDYDSNECGYTKYCNNSSWGYYDFVDNKTELEPEDDAAYVNWGQSWRMPSLEQIQELCNSCSWHWTQRNGVNGHLVTGPNGNTMFLPAAGYRCEGHLDAAGSHGYYWSRKLTEHPIYPHVLVFVSGSWFDWNGSHRIYGLPVRAVRVS